MHWQAPCQRPVLSPSFSSHPSRSHRLFPALCVSNPVWSRSCIKHRRLPSWRPLQALPDAGTSSRVKPDENPVLRSTGGPAAVTSGFEIVFPQNQSSEIENHVLSPPPPQKRGWLCCFLLCCFCQKKGGGGRALAIDSGSRRRLHFPNRSKSRESDINQKQKKSNLLKHYHTHAVAH